MLVSKNVHQNSNDAAKTLKRRTHGSLDPNRLRTRQLGHLLDIGKVKLALVGPILWRKHILLPRLAQHALHRNLALGQTFWVFSPLPLVCHVLGNPPPIHQNRAAVCPFQGRNDHVPLLALPHARANEHFLVMAKRALGHDAAVVKRLLDSVGVDSRGQREGFADDSVFALGEQVGFPLQTKDLPRPQGKGRHGDQGEDDEPRPVASAAGADERRGVVEDGVEGWVVGWLAGLAGGLLLAAAEGGVGEGLCSFWSAACLERLAGLSYGRRGPWEAREGLHLCRVGWLSSPISNKSFSALGRVELCQFTCRLRNDSNLAL